MNGSQQQEAEGTSPKPPLATGAASNGNTAATKKRKKDGLTPIVTEEPVQSG